MLGLDLKNCDSKKNGEIKECHKVIDQLKAELDACQTTNRVQSEELKNCYQKIEQLQLQPQPQSKNDSKLSYFFEFYLRFVSRICCSS